MITTISSTNRKDSNSLKVAKAYLEILGNQEAGVQLLDLADLPRDIAFSECFGERTDSFQQNFIQLVEKSEKFIYAHTHVEGGGSDMNMISKCRSSKNNLIVKKSGADNSLEYVVASSVKGYRTTPLSAVVPQDSTN